MFDHNIYTRKYLAQAANGLVPDNDATKYNVSVRKASTESEWVWRAIGVHHLTSIENSRNHHVYCDVLGVDGLRVQGAELEISTGHKATIDKPSHEPGTNFPLWSNQGVAVSVSHSVDSIPVPSDVVDGMHYGWPDEPPNNTWGHHSFFVVFQLMRTRRVPDVTPPAQPPDTLDWLDGGQFAVEGNYVYQRISQQEIDAAREAQVTSSVFRWFNAA